MLPELLIRPPTPSDAEGISRVIARVVRETTARDHPAEIIDSVVVDFSPERLIPLVGA
jgi:hypothetical protein